MLNRAAIISRIAARISREMTEEDRMVALSITSTDSAAWFNCWLDGLDSLVDGRDGHIIALIESWDHVMRDVLTLNGCGMDVWLIRKLVPDPTIRGGIRKSHSWACTDEQDAVMLRMLLEMGRIR